MIYSQRRSVWVAESSCALPLDGKPPVTIVRMSTAGALRVCERLQAGVARKVPGVGAPAGKRGFADLDGGLYPSLPARGDGLLPGARLSGGG